MAGFWSRLFGSDGKPAPKSGEPEVAPDYRKRREQVLGLDAASAPGGLGAVLMETGYPEATVMLAVLADGAISLCHSQGGSLPGLGEHEGCRESAARVLEAAGSARGACIPAKDLPMPKDGHTHFYLVTAEGVRTGGGTEDDLVMGRHALSPLYQTAQILLTECRRADEARGRTPSSGE